jgi:hypothetical protein
MVFHRPLLLFEEEVAHTSERRGGTHGRRRFAVLLPKTGVEKAKNTLEKVRAVLLEAMSGKTYAPPSVLGS